MRKHASNFNVRTWVMAAAVAASLAGCGSGENGQIFGAPGGGVGVGGGSGSGVAGTCAAGNLPLGSADNFAVLGGASITLTNPTSVTGDIGSPSITPAGGPSTLVGTQFDTASGSLALIAAAVTAMQTGIGCATSRACDFKTSGSHWAARR